jgi:tetratricopeptide (TPR) repeat protein
MNNTLEHAKEFENAKQWTQAAEAYEHLLKQNPDNPELLQSCAWCLSRDQQHDKAVKHFSRLNELAPKVAKWPYMIGYQYYDQQRWEEAISWFDKALNLHDKYVVVLYRKGYAHRQLEQVGPALDLFSRCRAAWSALPDGTLKEKDRKNCAKAAYHQGSLLLSKSRSIAGDSTSQAAEILREAVELDPRDANHHYKLGVALLNACHVKEAIESFRQADRLSRGKDYVLDKLAQAYVADGHTEKAEECYVRIPFRNRKAYVNRNYGKLLITAAKLADAEQILHRAIEQEQRNHYGHYYLARVLTELRRYREAASELREACKLKRDTYNSEFTEAADLLEKIGKEHPEALEQGKPDRGAIQTFNRDRGFGFIHTDDEKRRFFHISNWCDEVDPKPGLRVEFVPTETEKGPAANNVQPEESVTT